MDDPLLVEVQAEDYWYEAYNMRTGDRGIFPAYYAIEVTKDPDHITGTKPPRWLVMLLIPCSPLRGEKEGVRQRMMGVATAGGGGGLYPMLGRELCRCRGMAMAIRDDPRHVLCLPALAKNSDWVDQFRVKFLGSVQVPYHKGNDVLCAAMQKVVSQPGLSPCVGAGRREGASCPHVLPTSARVFCLCLPADCHHAPPYCAL